jgi:amino acid permease
MGGLLLVVAALATERSVNILISVMHHYPSYTTYETMTQYVLRSRIYRRTMELSMLLFCGGCAVGYIIAIGDILEQSSLLFIANSRTYTLIFVWFVAMVPLSLLRNVQSLQYASAVGITAIGILVVAAYVHFIQHHSNSSWSTSLDEQNEDNVFESWSLVKLLWKWRQSGVHNQDGSVSTHSNVQLSDFLWPAHGLVSVLTSGPVFIFAFSCQANVCSIYDELKVNGSNHHVNNESNGHFNPATADRTKLEVMQRVTMIAIWFCTALYCSISVIALADFGTNLLPNMLSCYSDRGSFLIQFATAAMALAIVMAFPLNIFPARVTLIGIMVGNKSPVQQSHVNDTRMTTPNEGLTVALLQDEEEPACLTVSDNGGGNKERNGHHCNLLLLPLEVQPDAIGNENSTDNVNDNHIDTRRDSGNDNIDDCFNWKMHIVTTLLLTGMVLVLALIIPNISVVFGLLGGTASSWLGFCVPGLLGLQLSKDHHEMTGEKLLGTIVTSWMLLVGGIMVGLLTTGVTLYNTLIYPLF